MLLQPQSLNLYSKLPSSLVDWPIHLYLLTRHFYLDSPKLKMSNLKFFTSSHIQPLYHAAFPILDNDTTIEAWNLSHCRFPSSPLQWDSHWSCFFTYLLIQSCLSFPWSLSLPLFGHFPTWTISAASNRSPSYHQLSTSFLLLALASTCFQSHFPKLQMLSSSLTWHLQLFINWTLLTSPAVC